MLIVCPTCSTTYQIQLAALGAAGRSVRCSHCRNTWFATADSVVEEAALAQISARPSAPQRQPGNFDEATSDISLEGTHEPAAREERPLAAVEAPPLAPGEQVEANLSAPKFDPGEPENIETIAAQRARQTYAEREAKPTVLRRLISLPVLIVVLTAVLLGVLQWRATVVRHFPQTASLFSMLGMPVNLRGLTFQEVKSKGEFHDGVMVLVVEGVIVNLTRNTLDVPRLRFSLRNGAGHEVYAWTALPTRNTLGSGDGLPFRTRLASPPADGRDVIVRFFNRRDAALGAP